MLPDIENEIFTRIATMLREKYHGIYVAGEYQRSPAKFPCVTVVEADNYILEKTQTSQIENHTVLMYEVKVYSNLINGKKNQCKTILRDVDNLFGQLGFTRTTKSLVPNLEDATICQMLARYQGIQDKDNRIYQR